MPVFRSRFGDRALYLSRKGLAISAEQLTNLIPKLRKRRLLQRQCIHRVDYGPRFGKLVRDSLAEPAQILDGWILGQPHAELGGKVRGKPFDKLMFSAIGNMKIAGLAKALDGFSDSVLYQKWSQLALDFTITSQCQVAHRLIKSLQRALRGHVDEILAVVGRRYHRYEALLLQRAQHRARLASCIIKSKNTLRPQLFGTEVHKGFNHVQGCRVRSC